MDTIDLDRARLVDTVQEQEREIQRLRETILMFCCSQSWAAQSWKDQPHVAPLFEEARKFSEES